VQKDNSTRYVISPSNGSIEEKAHILTKINDKSIVTMTVF